MAFGLLISRHICIMHQPPQKFSPLFCIKGLTICFNQTIRHRSGREGFLYRGFELIAFFESVSAYLRY